MFVCSFFAFVYGFSRCFFNFRFFFLFLRTPENPPKISADEIINYISNESRNRLAADRAETVSGSPTRPSYKHNTYFIHNSEHPSPSCRKSCRDTEYCTTRTITVCVRRKHNEPKRTILLFSSNPPRVRVVVREGCRYNKMKNWHNWRYSSFSGPGKFFFPPKFESIF